MFALEFFKLILIKTKLFCSFLTILNEKNILWGFYVGNKTAIKHNQRLISVKKSFINQIVLNAKKKKKL